MTLNQTELKLLNEFLEDLSDRMGNAGCNDFDMPNTPEGKQLEIDINSHYKDNPNASCFDFCVLDYLKFRLNQIHGISPLTSEADPI